MGQFERYGEDLTALLDAQPEPLVERPEVTRLYVAALLRRSGGNAALVAPRGGGKRTAVRSLAQQLARGTGPPELSGRQVYWLDARRLVTGTRYRGELEERVGRITGEVTAGQGRLVTVLDGAELLVAGDASGSGAAALATLLSSGAWLLPALPQQLAALAAAVPGWDALVQPITLPEWDDASAVSVAAGWLPVLSEHHALTYPADNPLLAVRLSRRFLRTPALPGSAVELLDQAGALARVDGLESAGRPHLLAAVAARTGLPLAGLDATLPGVGNELSVTMLAVLVVALSTAVAVRAGRSDRLETPAGDQPQRDEDVHAH